jgi:hypothetical protein
MTRPGGIQGLCCYVEIRKQARNAISIPRLNAVVPYSPSLDVLEKSDEVKVL